MRRSFFRSLLYGPLTLLFVVGVTCSLLSPAASAQRASRDAFDCFHLSPDQWKTSLRAAVTAGRIEDPRRRALPRIVGHAAARPTPATFRGIPNTPTVERGDIFLYADSAGVLSREFTLGEVIDLMAEAANELIAQRRDRFDFVGFFLSFQPHNQFGGAFYLPIENDVTGLGQSLFQDRPSLGLAGENIEGLVMMWREGTWSAADSSFGDLTKLVLGQEFEHRFGMHLNPLLDGRVLQGNDGACGRTAHWNFRVDAQGSGMEVREWVGSPAVFLDPDTCLGFLAPQLCYNTDIGRSPTGLGAVYSLPDLYLMGYVSPQEMDDLSSQLRYLDNNVSCESPWTGLVTNWSSADVIASHGPRLPSHLDAQQHFRTGWIMLHKANERPDDSQIQNVVDVLNRWTETYNWGTLGRGTMDNTLQRPFEIIYPNGAPRTAPPNQPIDIQVATIDLSSVPDTDSGRLHYSIDGGPFQTTSLSNVGGGDFVGTLPGIACGSITQFYVSVDSLDGETVTNPANAPSETRAVVAAEAVVVADDFETDFGWTINNQDGLTGGAWERGQPSGSGELGDPVSDYDESGQCFLTGNASGNSDVDSGTAILTSPVFDLSDLATAHITYARWYTNTLGGPNQDDFLLVEVSDDGGESWSTLEIVGPTPDDPNPEVRGGWFVRSHRLARTVPESDRFRIRFTAADVGADSLIEAGLDAFAIVDCRMEPSCDDGVTNQGEDRTDCGGPCPDCACLADTVCDDSVFCNGLEICDAFGQCLAGDNPCPNQLCEESNGVCVECLTESDCGDNVDCTDDACESGACVHTPNNDSCDSPLFCEPQECHPTFGCQAAPDRCPGRQCDEAGDICVGPARFMCQVSDSHVDVSGRLEMDVLIAGVHQLAEIGVAVAIERTSGNGGAFVDCPGGMTVDDGRSDYIFIDAPLVLGGSNCENLSYTASLIGGASVNVPWEPAYLLTYVIDVSKDATDESTFAVTILPSPDSFLIDVTGEPISSTAAPACTFAVGPCETRPLGDATGDGVVDLHDILCVLDGLAGSFENCTFDSVDIAPCGGNDVIDLIDILAMLDAFQARPSSCPDPCIDP